MRRILLILTVLALVWLGSYVYRSVRTGLAIRQDLVRLQEVAARPSPESLPVASQAIGDLDVRLTGLRSDAHPFLWLAARLGWLPGIGPDLQAAPALLEMAIAFTNGGHQALSAVGPLPGLLLERGQGDLLERAMPALAAARPGLAQAELRLEEGMAWRARIHSPLSPRLDHLLDRLDQAWPMAHTGLQLAQIAPALLGADGPRTYLILAQNSHELRATGGFISGVGTVRLNSGKIGDLKITDSYSVDNLKQPHPDAPPVLAQQMGAQILLLRDSNWSPDFPSSALVARALYEQDQGIPTDGTVAIDLEAVRLLVGALEPLQVPGMNQPVTSANVIQQIKQAWATPEGQGSSAKDRNGEWFARRKDFMGPLMMAALGRLLSGQDLRPIALAGALQQMLDGRHLQIAVDTPEVVETLRRNGWDGALGYRTGEDFLAVVDSNLGFNKTNAAVQQSIDYSVVPDPVGPVVDLTLTYTHTAPTLSGECDRSVRLTEGTYDEMIARCYWDYLRVYAPADSTLLDVQGLEEAVAEPGELGTTMLSGSFVLRPANTHVVHLRYRLPQSLAGKTYRLLVRKQAGTTEVPLRVRAGACHWETVFTSDRTYECPAWMK